MESFRITEPVQRLLRSCLLEEQDLVDAVRQGQREQVAGRPDHLRCLCTIAVRRPLDPETAELRKLEVDCRRAGGELEIYEVRGLEPAFEES